MLPPSVSIAIAVATFMLDDTTYANPPDDIADATFDTRIGAIALIDWAILLNESVAIMVTSVPCILSHRAGACINIMTINSANEVFSSLEDSVYRITCAVVESDNAINIAISVPTMSVPAGTKVLAICSIVTQTFCVGSPLQVRSQFPQPLFETSVFPPCPVLLLSCRLPFSLLSGEASCWLSRRRSIYRISFPFLLKGGIKHSLWRTTRRLMAANGQSLGKVFGVGEVEMQFSVDAESIVHPIAGVRNTHVPSILGVNFFGKHVARICFAPKTLSMASNAKSK